MHDFGLYNLNGQPDFCKSRAPPEVFWLAESDKISFKVIYSSITKLLMKHLLAPLFSGIDHLRVIVNPQWRKLFLCMKRKRNTICLTLTSRNAYIFFKL